MNNKYEYVSVISVDPQVMVTQPPKKEMKTFQTAASSQSQQFVTVLSINAPAISVNIDRPELVEVNRVGDEKIGFGLKFEGGIKNNEKIVRLFIQSCSPNTPASRAKASWGVLREGDEILEINGMRATQMSRLECVSNLKNSAGVIKLLILHRDAAGATRNQRLQTGHESSKAKNLIPPKPPVVPPRRINKTSFSTDGGGLKPVRPTPPPAPTTRETNYVNTKIVEIQSVIKPFDLLEKEFKIDSNQHCSSDEEKKKSSLTTSSENAAEQKVYENVEIIPPRPLPRLTILMNDLQKMEDDSQQQQQHVIQPLLPRLIDFHPKDTANSVTTSTEESQKMLSQSLQAQLQNISYEDFKFFDEDFCEDGENLGPLLGQLKLSEAYFNQHWNSKSLLPTIGEVEEDFVSMESNSTQHQNLINNNQQNIVNNNKIMTTNSNIASIKMHLDQPNHNHSYNDKNDDDNDKNCDHSMVKRQSYQLPAAKAKLQVGNKNEKQIPNDGEMKTKKVADTNNVKTNEKKSNCSPSATMTVTSNELQTVPPSTTMQPRITTAPLSDAKPLTLGDNNANRFSNHRRLIEGGDRKKEPLQNVRGTSTVTTITSSISNKTKANELHQQQPQNKNSNKKNMDNTTTKIVQTTVEKVERGLPDGDEFPANYFSETNGLLQLEKAKEIPSSHNKENGNHTNSQEDISPQKLFKLKTSSFERLSSKSALDANNGTPASNPFTTTATGNHINGHKSIDNNSLNKSDNNQQHYQRCLLIEKQKQNLPHWKKDEKSAKSVKDKIAMFSTENDAIVAPSLSSTSINSQSNANYKLPSLSKKSMSCDNLDDIDASMTSFAGDTMSSSSRDLYSASAVAEKSLSAGKPLPENKYLFQRAISIDHIPTYSAPVTAPPTLSKPPLTASAAMANVEPVFASRRGSLYDLSIEDQNKKSNSIKNLLEKRRKSMSKLRGLVIPEKVLESDENSDAPILLGLPEIKSKEVEKINFSKLAGQRPPPINSAPPTMSRSLDAKKVFSSQSYSAPSTIQRPKPQLVQAATASTTPIKKNTNLTLNLTPFEKPEPPKRPAYFKIPTSSLMSPATPPIKPPRTSRTSLSLHSSPRPASSIDSPSYSDDDSNLSSQISSPPQSPVEHRHPLNIAMAAAKHVPAEKFKLRRTTSSETNTSVASSNVTSSGSTSMPGTMKNRSTSTVSDATQISAASLTEYYDRKNILSSARCRSGANSNATTSFGTVHLKKKKPVQVEEDDDTTDGDELLACKIRQKNKVHERRTKNYVLVDQNAKNMDNLVDKVINVAYIEQITDTDTDENFGEYKPSAIENVLQLNSSVSKTQQFVDNLILANAMQKSGEDSICSSIESSPSRSISAAEEDVPPVSRRSVVEERCSIVANARVSEAPKFVPAPRTIKPSLQTARDTIKTPSQTELKPNKGENELIAAHELITSQDLQLIIEEADPPLEKPEAFVVVLKRETPESSIGIILAGGSDYEAKEISIYKILNNSPAFKDGRLCKGDRILSINGLSMRGLTHRESVSVLKTPRKEAVIVVTRSKSLNTTVVTATASEKLRNVRELHLKEASMTSKLSQSAQSLEDEISTDSGNSSLKTLDKPSDGDKVVELYKDGAGLGFSIDGGFDSPGRGNVAITIKKVFMGGAAEKSGKIRAGDEIDKINGMTVEKMTRIEVWNMMKKLPNGNVQITLK